MGVGIHMMVVDDGGIGFRFRVRDLRSRGGARAGSSGRMP